MGDAGSEGEAGVDDTFDEYSGEAGSAGEGALTPAAASPQGKAWTRSLEDEWGQRQIFRSFAMHLLVHLSSAYFLRSTHGFFILPLVYCFALHGRLHEAAFEGWGCAGFRCCRVSI